MLSPEFVDVKRLRTEMGFLNKSGAIPEDKKLRSVGVKKDEMVKGFLASVQSVPEGSEEEKLLPDTVVEFFNDIVNGEDPSPEEQAKMKSKKKASKPRETSNEAVAYNMIKEGKSEEEIADFFTKRYTERGQKDPDFIKKRIAIYTNIAKKRIKAESGADAEEPAAEEAAAE